MIAASPSSRTGPSRGVVIGVSAGAVEALSILLPPLRPDFPAPIIVVVHVPPDKKSGLADLFAAKCQLSVREVEDKEPLAAGTVYFAPPDYHVLVESRDALALSSEEPVNFSRPAIDVLFESAADAYGPDLVAIILTGASHDGARGLQAVAAAGGVALVQKPESAYSPAMPQAALRACPTAQALSLPEIVLFLQKLAQPA